jgi:hypothetical protein
MTDFIAEMLCQAGEEKESPPEKHFKDFVRNNDYNNARYEYLRSNKKIGLLKAHDSDNRTPLHMV